ncbi:hypothetical protein BGX26_005244 [Mortierella sp. AD094]|nr:hypothetical protein BGX26_005244 [Mortierella sp. AD094]
MIVFGALLVFFGFKLIRVTLLLMGFVTWAVVATIVMAIVHWDMVSIFFHPAQYYFWMWFLAGLAGALISFRFWDMGVVFVGGFGGFSLAMGIIAACNTSFFSGAFLLMYGLDEFLQLGYREMFAIFGFTGRMLSYHPTKNVYTMIESSLGLACLGIIWELLLHKEPLWKDRKALFSVCGQQFGKRPAKLMGQRVHHRIRFSRWQHKTTEEAAYGGSNNLDATRDDGFNTVGQDGHLPTVVESEANSSSSFTTIEVYQVPGVSGVENLSDAETIAPSNSGTLSKSSSTHTTHTHEDQAGGVVSVSLLMPVEEDTDREDNTLEKVVTETQS